LKPKNQKEFNWSYVRFYLMWLLTCLLALVPLVVFFSGWVNCEDCKRNSSSDKNKVVEKVNYEEVAQGIDSLKLLVGQINKGNIKQNIDDLEDYAKIIKINSNENLGKKLEDLTEKIILICDKYKSEIEENKDEIRKLEVQINKLETDKQKLDLQLTGCRSSLKNNTGN